MSALELVRAGREHGPAIRDLLRSVFPDNPKTDERIMSWQYWANPYGTADSLVWLDGGEIVCHCANLPVPLRTKGRGRLGVITVDAATAPTHRGRGLYQALLHEGVRVAGERDLGISLYFETREGPSKQWDVGRVRLEPFVLPLDAGWLARRTRVPHAVAAAMVRTVFRVPGAGDAREVFVVPDGIDELWETVHAGGQWAIAKDWTWWRWRFARHPYGVYRFFEVRRDEELRGAAVTRRGAQDSEPVEYVVELLARDAAASRELVGAVARSAPDAGALVARATRASPSVRLMRATGMRRVPNRFERERPCVTWWPALVDYEASATLPWAITYGDTDTI